MTGTTIYMLIGIATLLRQAYLVKSLPRELEHWVGAAGIVAVWPLHLFAEWTRTRKGPTTQAEVIEVEHPASESFGVRIVPRPPRGAPKKVAVGDELQKDINCYAFGIGCALSAYIDAPTRKGVEAALKEAFNDATDHDLIPIQQLRLAEALQEVEQGLHSRR